MPRARCCLAVLLLASQFGHSRGAAYEVTDAGATARVAVLGDTPIAFQGSAFLINYYAGAVAALIERGVLVPGRTRLSGLSGGGLTSIFATLGSSGPQMGEEWRGLARQCAETYGEDCKGYLNVVIQRFLEQQLPDDVHKRLNGLVRIAVSQLDASKDNLNNSAAWVVSKWDSKEDVVSCALGSMTIPCMSFPSTYSIFRNQPVVDGGFANGFEDLCEDPANCIKIGTWVVGNKADQTCNASAPHSCSSCTVEDRTAEQKVYRLYKNSKLVDHWKLRAVQYQCPPYADERAPPYPLPDWVPQSSTMPDIHPGKYNPLPVFEGHQVIACEWKAWALDPPSNPEFFDVVYKQGVLDATAWCDEQVERIDNI